METHEVCELFPPMSEEEFKELCEDISKHGQREPIWTYRGKVIDGRNRLRACEELGMEPQFREWDGKGDLTAFVVSLNLYRRHLTESQRGMIAAKIKPRFEAEAKQRQVAAQNNNAARSVVANLPRQGDERGKARDKAAKLLNVSPRTTEAASKVIKNGIPELAKMVDAGEVKVSTAARVASKPRQQQEKIVARGPKAVKAVARRERERKLQATNKDKKPKLTSVSVPVDPKEAGRKLGQIFSRPKLEVLYKSAIETRDQLDRDLKRVDEPIG